MDEKVLKQRPKILITGANGFTGQHACYHFSKAGYEVIAVTRSGFNNSKIKVEQCDLTNKESIRSLINKTEPKYLLHLAGQNHVGESCIDPVSTIETNFLSTLYIIEALRLEQPTCKMVVVGSALQFNPVDFSTLNHPYSLSKTLQVLVAEAYTALYNLHITVAKPSNLIGPGFSNGVCSIFSKKIVEMEEGLEKNNILQINNLGAQRDFIDVRDAICAYEILLIKGRPGEVYEISSGFSYSLKEVVEKLKTLTSIPIQVNAQNDFTEKKLEINSNKIINLGWKPVIPIQTSLADTLNFYRRNKPK